MKHIRKKLIKIILVLTIVIIYNLIGCGKGCKNEENTPLRETPTVTNHDDDQKNFDIKIIKVDEKPNLKTLIEEDIADVGAYGSKYVDNCKLQNLKSIHKNTKAILKHIMNGIKKDDLLNAYESASYQKYALSDNINSLWNQILILTEAGVDNVIQAIPNTNMEYKPDTEDIAYYFTDFANKEISGSPYGGGFVQEEQLMLETLLCFVCSDRYPKKGKEPFLLKENEIAIFNEIPKFFEFDAKKIYNLKQDRYEKIETVANSLSGSDKYLKKLNSVIKSNILVIDAPSFPTKPTDKTGYTDDQLNMILGKLITAYKACKNQAKQNGKKEVCIITGNLGMGVFKNNGNVIYSLNILAALFVNAKGDGPKINLEAYTLDHSASSYCSNNISKIKQLIKELSDNKEDITLKKIWNKLPI